jgi:hypothetical protein
VFYDCPVLEYPAAAHAIVETHEHRSRPPKRLRAAPCVRPENRFLGNFSEIAGRLKAEVLRIDLARLEKMPASTKSRVRTDSPCKLTPLVMKMTSISMRMYA